MVLSGSAINGITSRSRKSPEHKTLFCDVQEVNIHEPRKTAITLLQLANVASECLFSKKRKIEEKSIP
jgi:hypothetical protein